MSYAERMDGPSPVEISLPDQQVTKERDTSIQRRAIEIKELIKKDGLDAAVLEIATKQIDLETENTNLSEQAKLAGKDGLTGVDNRRRFDEEITKEMSSAARTGETLSLLFIDLNELKYINNTFGHPAGDAALREIARMLTASLRLTDSVYRYGGDEFTALLPETKKEQATEVGMRLTEKAKGLKITIDGQEITINAAIGVNSCRPADKNLPPRADKTILRPFEKELIDGADQAMYAGKHSGKVGVFIEDAEEKAEIDAFFHQKDLGTKNVLFVPK